MQRILSSAVGPFLSSTFSQAGWSQDGPHGVNHPRQAVDLTDKHVRPRITGLDLSVSLSLSFSLPPQSRVLTSARSSLFICLSTWSPVLFCVSMRPSTTIVHRISNAIRKTRSAPVVRYIRKRGEDLAEIIDSPSKRQPVRGITRKDLLTIRSEIARNSCGNEKRRRCLKFKYLKNNRRYLNFGRQQKHQRRLGSTKFGNCYL